MIYRVSEDIWFDNEKLYIIHGAYNKRMYLKNYNNYSNIKEEKQVSGYPTIIFISSTTCNLKCRYCYANEGTYNNVSKRTKFELDDYISVFETSIKKFGKVKAICFFGGEPLLNYNVIKKFVEYLHENYKQEQIPELAIASNGIIMNEDIKNFIRDYHIGYSTSLDGTKDFNDLCRIGDGIDSVHDKVVASLKALEDVDVPKVVQFTITKEHIKDYKKGDYSDWAEHMESLGIAKYEIVAVTTDKEDLELDFSDRKLYDNYVCLCRDMATYCLNALATGKTIVMPRTFNAIILSIIKRKYHLDCNAGFSFSVSPDRKVYPCHMFASDKDYAIDFGDNFVEEMKAHEKFNHIREMTRLDFEECNNCIAKNICPYFCKGFYNKAVSEERCLMMQIFTEETIKFMVNIYPDKKECVNRALVEISKIGY